MSTSKSSTLAMLAASIDSPAKKKAKKASAAAKKKAEAPAKKAIKAAVSGVVETTKKQSGNELQDTLRQFIAESLNGMMDTFAELSPSKQWDLIVQLLPYATPKMASTDINANMDFDPLASQLGQLANEIAPEEEDNTTMYSSEDLVS